MQNYQLNWEQYNLLNPTFWWSRLIKFISKSNPKNLNLYLLFQWVYIFLCFSRFRKNLNSIKEYLYNILNRYLYGF